MAHQATAVPRAVKARDSFAKSQEQEKYPAPRRGRFVIPRQNKGLCHAFKSFKMAFELDTVAYASNPSI